MAEIKAGDDISAEWWPDSVEVEENTAQSNISSTSFVAGSPECGVGFTSPRTGRIAVCVSGGLVEQSAGDRVFLAFEVYRGTSASGTLVRSARTGFGISTSGDTTAGGSGEQVHGNMAMVDGLTPGVDHYARTVHSVDAGATNDITRRRLTVIPLP